MMMMMMTMMFMMMMMMLIDDDDVDDHDDVDHDDVDDDDDVGNRASPLSNKCLPNRQPVVGNVGIKMVKATGAFRADMLRHWVRLRAFHESLMEHDADALADFAFCVVCGKRSKETQNNKQYSRGIVVIMVMMITVTSDMKFILIHQA